MYIATNTSSIKINKPCCPFCHDEFQVEQEKTGCSLCLAWFHKECWDEYGGCTSCKGARLPETTNTPRPVIQISMSDSIHDSSGFAILSKEDRDAARAAGRKGGIAACQVLSAPHCDPNPPLQSKIYTAPIRNSLRHDSLIRSDVFSHN
ncbi:MAG: hypothetical protein P1V97_21615 [Planctomycetota bacterium]|nr:hypothetical protein [Planctomycetota bacterium]